MQRETKPKTWAISAKDPLPNIGSTQSDRLSQTLQLIDSYLQIPSKITVNGTVLEVLPSEIQLRESDGQNGYRLTQKLGAPLVNGKYRLFVGSVNTANGAVTGTCQSPPVPPAMNAGDKIFMGLYGTDSGQIHCVFGTPHSTSPDINSIPWPNHKTTRYQALGIVRLTASVSGASWACFQAPFKSDITLLPMTGDRAPVPMALAELVDVDLNTLAPADKQVLTFDIATKLWSAQDLPSDVVGVTKLSECSDVNTAGATAGQLLGFNGTTWTHVDPPSGGSTIDNLDDIKDVELNLPNNGQALVYQNGKWVNSTVSGGSGATVLDELGDVIVSTPAAGQTLVYDDVSKAFKNQSASSLLGSSKLADLADVAATVATDGQALVWNDSSKTWQPGTVSGGGGASALDGLTDVTISGPTNGQVLGYDNGTKQWVNFSPSLLSVGAQDVAYTSTTLDVSGNNRTFARRFTASTVDMEIVGLSDVMNFTAVMWNDRSDSGDVLINWVQNIAWLSNPPQAIPAGMAATYRFQRVDGQIYGEVINGVRAGTRGLFGGGYTGSAKVNLIEFITLSSLGNSASWSELAQAKDQLAACSSCLKGIFAGGNVSGQVATIDQVSITSAAASSSFGNLTASKSLLSACSSATRGLIGGGTDGAAAQNNIDYITISTAGNAQDFGDLFASRYGLAACASSTRGVFAGGNGPVNLIDYVTISTLGNAATFGIMTLTRNNLASCANPTKGVFGGGSNAGETNVVDYITIASAANAVDFGDLTMARLSLAACSTTSRGVFAGGDAGGTKNVMDYITFSAAGNATDFGDLSAVRQNLAGCSNSHGGVS